MNLEEKNRCQNGELGTEHYLSFQNKVAIITCVLLNVILDSIFMFDWVLKEFP